MHSFRKPAVHFAVIGVALFALERSVTPPQVASERPRIITITAARLADLASDAERTGSGLDRAALLDRAIEEEVLYREALGRGLDRGDQSIQWRLAEKMRFLSAQSRDEATLPRGVDRDLYRQALTLGLDREDPLVRGLLVEKMRLLLRRFASDQQPSDHELQAYLEQHRERFLEPARVSLRHVYFARDARPGTLDSDMRRALEQLRGGAGSATSVRLGDPFPMGSVFRGQSEKDLTRIFGVEFATAVLALEAGAWTPLRSPYGLHLVRVEEKSPAQLPDLDAVRSRVLAQYRDERQDHRLADEIRALRSTYTVRVESTVGGRG